MADIVSGLFGLSPQDVIQQQQDVAYKKALAESQLDPFQRSGMMLSQGGAGLTNAIAPALGLQNTQLEAAKTREAALQQLDLQSPDSIRAAGEQARQRGDYQLAAQLGQLANQRESEQAKINLESSQAAKAAAEANKQPPVVAPPMHSFEKDGYKVTQQWDPTTNTYVEIARNKIKEPGGAGAGGVTPPKNLTREAKLGWELAHGLITQETYDNAMAASSGGKLATEQNKSTTGALVTLDAIKQNLDKLYDPTTKKLKPEADALFGKFGQFAPDAILSQNSVDARVALSALTDQIMMKNLAEAKAQVGQSFGAMQVQEWDKFVNQLVSLSRAQSPESAAAAFKYVNDYIAKNRNVIEAALKPKDKSALAPKNPSNKPVDFGSLK